MNVTGDLGIARTFRGRLSHEGHSVFVSFTAHIEKSGEIKLVVDEFPASTKSMSIIDAWHKARARVPNFEITGESEDAWRFESDYIDFTSVGWTHDPAKGAHHKLTTGSVSGMFSRPLRQPEIPPTVISWIRGFGCLPALETTCPLGRVVMTGPTEHHEIAELSGFITVQALQEVSEISTWHKDVDEFVLYIKRMMSFVAGGNITNPVKQFSHPSELIVRVQRVGMQNAFPFPVCHILQRQSIFEVAVKAYFGIDRSPNIRDIWTALEWACINTYYSEIRLTNAIIAMENIVHVYSKDSERIMSDRQFRKLRKHLESEMEIYIRQHMQLDDPESAIDYMRSKIPELQRRPIKSRLLDLLSTLSVPMTDLDENMIGAAYSARNKITHTGMHSVTTQPQQGLWTHGTVIRELVTRLVFRLLGYSGHYISYLSGSQFAIFPPCGVPGDIENEN